MKPQEGVKPNTIASRRRICSVQPFTSADVTPRQRAVRDISTIAEVSVSDFSCQKEEVEMEADHCSPDAAVSSGS